MILGAERIKYFEMGPFTKDVTPFIEIFDPPPSHNVFLKFLTVQGVPA